MLQLRLKLSTECKHCGVKTDEFWLWEHQIQEKYICGNCHFQEVILTGVVDSEEIDPLKPKNK
ncbi:hypothetical protein [Priestia megaterium]|uniref:hypothetical protein n=1 Tax=Priestia megaterium TaxID=1404 RepID=UPI00112ADD2F|nr:hypothetical protein [Priestia megaterium]TPF17973.1 hypothetical protein CBE78_01745 [Priestia megaterium]TPF22081.1 hypothetical protein CBE79_04250 [Priestia megaterium]